jgi:hypothetical protein
MVSLIHAKLGLNGNQKSKYNHCPVINILSSLPRRKNNAEVIKNHFYKTLKIFYGQI